MALSLVALAKSKLANEVITTHDGAEALDFLYRREGNAAVVLLELKLPKLDGVEELRQIKDDPNCGASRWSC